MDETGARHGEEQMKSPVKGRARHPFRWTVSDGDKTKIVTIWARVRYGKTTVKLLLSADDVQRSIDMKGVGNTQNCSMAVCAKRHAASFPHPVEGTIDWTYSRAYVMSNLDKKGHYVCWAYEHRDSIAKLNDSKGGQLKLLAQLKKNGDRLIRLNPIKPARVRPGRARGKDDGSRSTRTLGVGAKLRFAVAQAGGVVS